MMANHVAYVFGCPEHSESWAHDAHCTRLRWTMFESCNLRFALVTLERFYILLLTEDGLTASTIACQVYHQVRRKQRPDQSEGGERL